jgi:DNA polymerase I-like protein with 3'-5' exonuclease and polymerase domains
VNNVKILALDTEHTYGVMRPYEKNFELACVSWATEKDSGIIWVDHSDIPHEAEEKIHWSYLVRKLVDEADIVIAHNLKHDMTILRYYGISFEKVKLHCTMVTEYLLSGQNTKERTFSLDKVAEQYDLPVKKIDKASLYWKEGYATRDIPIDILEEYAIRDAEMTRGIYLGQQSLIDDGGFRKIVDLQNEFTLSLSDMELNGFKFDVETALKIVDEQASLLAGWEKEVEAMFGYPHLNIGSNQQLSALLYGGALKRTWKEWKVKELTSKPESLFKETTVTDTKLIKGLEFKPLPKTILKNGYYKTDKETISQLKVKTPEQKRMKKLIIDYSNAKKVKETIKGLGTKGLVHKVCADGKIHPNLNQTVTATGRLSASNPNSQNFPRNSTSPIKNCIVPEFDGIMQVDLSQIEWRVAAELSGDKMMLYEINSGIDQHNKAVTDLMDLPLTKENRTNAKFFNFRMIYGGTAYGFYMDQKMPNWPLKHWEKAVKNFFGKYFTLKEWQDDNVVSVEKNGVLRAPTGRMFVFHKVLRKGGLDVYNERQVKNYPVQGVAGGDILPLASCIIRRGLHARGLASKLILTVHDSLVLDYKETERDGLIQLLSEVVNHLRSYIKAYFDIPWVGKIEGEVELGANYGSLSPVDAS